MALPAPHVQPTRQARQERSEVREFLKHAHIGKVGTTATIQIAGNVRLVDGNFGEQVVCDCEYDGKRFVFAVNTDSPNYAIMVANFSDDEKKWFGPIDVQVKQGVTSAYLIVCEADEKTSKPGKRATRRTKK